MKKTFYLVLSKTRNEFSIRSVYHRVTSDSRYRKLNTIEKVLSY